MTEVVNACELVANAEPVGTWFAAEELVTSEFEFLIGIIIDRKAWRNLCELSIWGLNIIFSDRGCPADVPMRSARLNVTILQGLLFFRVYYFIREVKIKNCLIFTLIYLLAASNYKSLQLLAVVPRL